jgi:hypothetical protein
MTERINPAASACADFEADLVLLHYGDLDGAERARLQTHAANCAGCSGYLNELATLLPLTDQTDTPPQEFWMNYNRELRHKIDAAVENKSWWQNFTAIFRPGYLPALATAAVVVLALTFSLGGGLWSAKNGTPDVELTEALPVAENLEFFRAMDVLDELDLLEVMDSQGNNAA